MNATSGSTVHEDQEWTFDVGPCERSGNSFVAAWHQRVVKYLEFSTVLRVFGAGVTVAAIGVFLFQHWEAGNDLSRYAMLLGQTVLLCLMGFGTSRILREPKSARVFLALGLVSTAASASVLGALLYSTVQWDAVSVSYPGFAYWQVASTGEALSWMAGSLVLLVPISVLGFMVLARPAALRLSTLFLVNAALLLLPIRDPAMAAGMAAAAGVVSFVVLARIRRIEPAVRTREGRTARLIVMLPVAVIAVRCGYLYAASSVSVGCLGLLAYATLRQIGVTSPPRPAARRSLEILSLAPLAVTALAAGAFTSRMVSYRFDDELAVAAFALVLIAGCTDLSRRSLFDSRIYARGAALVALGAGATELFMDSSMVSALICAVVSGAVAAYARGAGFDGLYRISLLAVLGALGYHVYFAVNAFDLGGWLGLAVLGVVAITGAAAVERHGERFKGLVLAFLPRPRRG